MEKQPARANSNAEHARKSLGEGFWVMAVSRALEMAGIRPAGQAESKSLSVTLFSEIQP